MQTLEAIVQKISRETGKEEAEISELIEGKKQKFPGLLTDEAAAFMIAREMNVEIEPEPFPRLENKITLAEIRDGMQGIELEAKVVHVFSPKDFEKENRKGKLCSLIVSDQTGENRLTVWNEGIKKLERIEKGDTIIAKNCYVKTFQEKPQLSLSFNGEIVLKEKGTDESKVKIKDLQENMNDISVNGKIASNFGVKNFQKAEGEGKITALELEDDTGKTRVAAWNELAEEASGLKPGQEIKIEGAYTKQGQSELEIHLGWRARIIKF